MPGQTGSSGAPGDARISLSQSPFRTPEAGAVIPIGGVYTSDVLSLVGLPGVSILVNNNSANLMTVQCEVAVQATFMQLPAVAVAAGANVFVSYDHIAARLARFTLTGTVGDGFDALLSATAS